MAGTAAPLVDRQHHSNYRNPALLQYREVGKDSGRCCLSKSVSGQLVRQCDWSVVRRSRTLDVWGPGSSAGIALVGEGD